MTEKKVLGILAIVFGGVGLLFSWMPFINNMAFILAVVGLVLGIIAIVTNRKSKKTLAIIGTVISVISIIIVLATQSSYSNQLDKAFDSNSSSSTKKSKTEKANNKTTSDSNDPSKSKWTYKDDTFKAGILTYKFTKSEVRDSSEDGKKALVLYADVTNNTDDEQDPSNIYIVMHAYQKNDTSNKSLTPGMVATDADYNDPLQEQEDALNNKLLGKKTVSVVMIYTLENDNPVTVKFDNADYKTIGEKQYTVK
ncbi:DUF5067 domain-containing protein [Leuconostoc pseudomesenteroides]|uniref:DUF5067 domain-containing protein n=1 Tax=Leuconostoc pseudomesenteroides TaxID=33968 RepID=UPI0021A8FE3B|nr:DUF5067 domain-containing protein [Leuconostoc pseudomesenteroides]MCT4412826.1 DUF5067 domain-containing protein [Leuconostoc pseudomesenteroides]